MSAPIRGVLGGVGGCELVGVLLPSNAADSMPVALGPGDPTDLWG